MAEVKHHIRWDIVRDEHVLTYRGKVGHCVPMAIPAKHRR